MTSQAEGSEFKPWLALLMFSKLMCGFQFEMYNELYGEGSHSEAPCTSLRSNSVVRVELQFHICTAWDLWPKPSYTERRPVSGSRMYIGWDEVNYVKEEQKYELCINI